MAQFEPEIAEIEQAGAQLVFIAAQKRAGWWRLASFFKKHPSSFPFLLDEDRSVTKAYGLYHRLGKDAINIAHPATLVIDRSGIVQYIFRGDHQAERAPMQQVMAAVKKLSNG